MSSTHSDTMRIGCRTFRMLAACLAIPLASAAAAEEAPDAKGKEPSTEALAKAAQNPVANMVVIPFQDNIGLGYGPGNKGTQNVLNFQPVIPLHVTGDWNVITPDHPAHRHAAELHRRIEHHRAREPEHDRVRLPSPARCRHLGEWGQWRASPRRRLLFLGSQSTWGLGPSAVVLTMPGPWVVGVLVNQVWSVAGASASNFLLQYFVNYNFAGGWYVTTAPS